MLVEFRVTCNNYEVNVTFLNNYQKLKKVGNLTPNMANEMRSYYKYSDLDAIAVKFLCINTNTDAIICQLQTYIDYRAIQLN